MSRGQPTAFHKWKQPPCTSQPRSPEAGMAPWQPVYPTVSSFLALACSSGPFSWCRVRALPQYEYSFEQAGYFSSYMHGRAGASLPTRWDIFLWGRESPCGTHYGSLIVASGLCRRRALACRYHLDVDQPTTHQRLPHSLSSQSPPAPDRARTPRPRQHHRRTGALVEMRLGRDSQP